MAETQYDIDDVTDIVTVVADQTVRSAIEIAYNTAATAFAISKGQEQDPSDPEFLVEAGDFAFDIVGKYLEMFNEHKRDVARQVSEYMAQKAEGDAAEAEGFADGIDWDAVAGN